MTLTLNEFNNPFLSNPEGWNPFLALAFSGGCPKKSTLDNLAKPTIVKRISVFTENDLWL